MLCLCWPACQQMSCPYATSPQSKITHPTFCIQVLSYFVNVKDQTFLATVFKNILQGVWSIKQAINVCRNKTMNTKLETAVRYHLDEYIQTKATEATDRGEDVSFLNNSMLLADLVHEISGWVYQPNVAQM